MEGKWFEGFHSSRRSGFGRQGARSVGAVARYDKRGFSGGSFHRIHIERLPGLRLTLTLLTVAGSLCVGFIVGALLDPPTGPGPTVPPTESAP